jgi:hypothetical protein
MTLYKKIVFILVVVAMLVIPASAYYSLTEQTVNVDANLYENVCSGGPLHTMYINIRDVNSFKGNVSYITQQGLRGFRSANSTGYYPFTIYDGALGDMGNGTVRWSWSPLASWAGDGYILVEISDFNPKSDTGYHVYQLKGTVCSDAWYVYHSNTNFATSSHYTGPWASGVFTGSNNRILNGTFGVFTGSLGGSVPTGFIRTTVHTTDGLTGSQIIGTNINLHDVENSSWTNSTPDADGELIIDVLEGHTLDIYGSYPGVYTASAEYGATPGGDYYLPLYPPVPTAPENFVNLFVYMREAGNLLAISDVDVSFRYPSGTTVYSKSDSSGTAMQIVPNQTVIIIGATKTGWNGQSVSTTTGNFDDKFVTITLSRASAPTAAPTAGAVVTNPATGLPITDPITGLPMTVAPMLDVRTPAEKDTDLLNQLRDAGPSIIGLCILAIIFGLLKMIMKF